MQTSLASDARSHLRAAAHALVSGRGWAWFVLGCATVGAVGDASTTICDELVGGGVEGNPGAAWVISTLGVYGWAAASVLLTLLLGALAAARPTSPVGRALLLIGAGVITAKVSVTISNAALLWSFLDA